jgi:hypothetical protein
MPSAAAVAVAVAEAAPGSADGLDYRAAAPPPPGGALSSPVLPKGNYTFGGWSLDVMPRQFACLVLGPRSQPPGANASSGRGRRLTLASDGTVSLILPRLSGHPRPPSGGGTAVAVRSGHGAVRAGGGGGGGSSETDR